MHMLAALDLATGKISYRIRTRKRWREFLGLLKTLRQRWPEQRLYLVLDNFSPHKHAEVRTWAADHDVELVFLPTCGSWRNRIESEFAALRCFALNGDHRTHAEPKAAIAACIRRRNAHAEPKTRFASGSPIRQWIRGPGQGCLTMPSDSDLCWMHVADGWPRPDRRGTYPRSGHHGTTPLSSNSWPVGPSSDKVASRMAIAAPCSGVCVPLNPLRSVAT